MAPYTKQVFYLIPCLSKASLTGDRQNKYVVRVRLYSLGRMKGKKDRVAFIVIAATATAKKLFLFL